LEKVLRDSIELEIGQHLDAVVLPFQVESDVYLETANDPWLACGVVSESAAVQIQLHYGAGGLQCPRETRADLGLLRVKSPSVHMVLDTLL
jgi:hypothetical protein